MKDKYIIIRYLKDSTCQIVTFYESDFRQKEEYEKTKIEMNHTDSKYTRVYMATITAMASFKLIPQVVDDKSFDL
jgi:hypothetical protein